MRNMLKFLPLDRHEAQRITEVLGTMKIREVLAHTLVTALTLITIPVLLFALSAQPTVA